MWVGSQRTIWSHLQWVLRGNGTTAILSITGFAINGVFKNSEHVTFGIRGKDNYINFIFFL